MNQLLRISTVLLLFVPAIICFHNVDKSQVARARVESCPGCSLKRIPEIKAFIFDDVPQYENVEFKKVNGAPPELILLDQSDNELVRFPLSELDRKQANDLLKQWGFQKKADEL